MRLAESNETHCILELVSSKVSSIYNKRYIYPGIYRHSFMIKTITMKSRPAFSRRNINVAVYVGNDRMADDQKAHVAEDTTNYLCHKRIEGN